jgi:hypothetical protein
MTSQNIDLPPFNTQHKQTTNYITDTRLQLRELVDKLF